MVDDTALDIDADGNPALDHHRFSAWSRSSGAAPGSAPPPRAAEQQPITGNLPTEQAFPRSFSAIRLAQLLHLQMQLPMQLQINPALHALHATDAGPKHFKPRN